MRSGSIHDELLKLGSMSLRPRRQVHGQEQARAVTDLKGVSSHRAAGIGALDFLVVPTVGLRLLLGLIILRHQHRRLISCSVAAHPTAEWIARRITDAFLE